MRTKRLLILSLLLLASACSPRAQANPADQFAGKWAGRMKFSDDPSHLADVIVTIPTGCSTGGICGDIFNQNGCQWEMRLVSVRDTVFEYKFSKTLSGGEQCGPGVGTGGTLTLDTDGKLKREHKTPKFTASGTLKRQ